MKNLQLRLSVITLVLLSIMSLTSCSSDDIEDVEDVDVIESPYNPFLVSIEKVGYCESFDSSAFEYSKTFYHLGDLEFPQVGEIVYYFNDDNEPIIYIGEDDLRYYVIENGHPLNVTSNGEFQYMECE